MQNCPTPARDVFTHATEPVSSVVVVPLMVNDAALGALYFTQDTPCSDFSNIQDALLVGGVVDARVCVRVRARARV